MSTELEQLKARCERLELLLQVGDIIHSTVQPDEALHLILDLALKVTLATSGSVVLVNPNSGVLEIHASLGLPANAKEVRLRLNEGVTGWVARKGQPIRLGDVSKDPRYISIRDTVKSELAVPLAVNGEVRGVLNVDSNLAYAFTQEHQDLLEAMAHSAARVIQSTWLYEQSRLKARLFETLSRVSQTINSALNLDDALQLITREACQMMQGKLCTLMMLEKSQKILELRAMHGNAESYRNNPRISVEDSILGVVIRRRKPIQIENAQVSGRYTAVEQAQQEGLMAFLSVPLVFAGQAIGTLSVYTGNAHKFSDEEIRILTALAELSAIAIEKARLYERVVDVEEQLRQNEKLSALGLLAAEVAHEIRNPLTVMKMLYHSLDLKFPSGDPRNRDAEIISEKIEHLNKIVEQILAFARTSEPDLKDVNLNDIIEELGLLVRHKLRNQGIEFIRLLDPALPVVKADSTQLEQAFLNLILNSAEAMAEGGVLTISTYAEPAANKSQIRYLVVEVADTGEGMTKEQCERAFIGVLNTTKAKGTGLGLAITSRVIEAHGGKISAESEVGEGTIIRVRLPMMD